jgi:hypothetical protein
VLPALRARRLANDERSVEVAAVDGLLEERATELFGDQLVEDVFDLLFAGRGRSQEALREAFGQAVVAVSVPTLGIRHERASGVFADVVFVGTFHVCPPAWLPVFEA